MKLILAWTEGSAAEESGQAKEALLAALVEAGHQVEEVVLPLPSTDSRLASLASYRLMSIEPWCDALLCLDPISCTLGHARKVAVLLSTCHLPAEDERQPELALFGDVLISGIAECQLRFAQAGLITDCLYRSSDLNCEVLGQPVIKSAGKDQGKPSRTVDFGAVVNVLAA